MSGSVTSVATVLRLLGDLCGRPVRLTFLNPESRVRLARVTGLLVSAGPAGLVVDCLVPVPTLPACISATVEVMVDGNLYWWCSTPGEATMSGRTQCRLNLPETVESVQRRRFPRVDTDRPIQVFVTGTEMRRASTLLDLSAGGASFSVQAPLASGQRVTLVALLGTGLPFQEIDAVVLRCVANGEGSFITAVQFESGPQVQDALAVWVERQLAESSASST